MTKFFKAQKSVQTWLTIERNIPILKFKEKREKQKSEYDLSTPRGEVYIRIIIYYLCHTKIMSIEWSQWLGSSPKSAFSLHQAVLLGQQVWPRVPDDSLQPQYMSIKTHSFPPQAVFPGAILFPFQMLCPIAWLALTTDLAGSCPDSWRPGRLCCVGWWNLACLLFKGKNCLSKSFHPVSVSINN